MKNKINEVILLKLEDYFDSVKDLYEHPEIGMQEYRTSKCLKEHLEEEGFDVTYPYFLETAFKAEYKSKKKGPTIAFMAEYDALPGVGHGCGHNMICNISMLAATGFKAVVDQVGGTILVIGTPAEENFGGKVQLVKKGAFDDVDVALMLHPDSKNGLGGKSNAIIPVKFYFKGKSAHGCDPEKGASALDAAVLTYSGINMLRQFAEPGSFIHGIFSDGGDAANIIPDHAALEYYFRATTLAYAKTLVDRALKVAEGACISTNTTFTWDYYEETYSDTLINYTLADSLKKCMEEAGLTEIAPVFEGPGGSTDVGAVSYVCPTIQGYVKIAEPDVLGHSKEMAKATISYEGKQALYKGALSLAYLALEIAESKDLLEKMKKEFKTSVEL